MATITPPRIRFRRELTPRGFEGNSCTSVRMRREPYTACTRASCSNGGATNLPQRSPPHSPPDWQVRRPASAAASGRVLGGGAYRRAHGRMNGHLGHVHHAVAGIWLEDGHLHIAADRARSANVRGAPDGRGAGAPGAGAESPPAPSHTTRRCMSHSKRAEVEVWLQVDEHGYISLPPPLARCLPQPPRWLHAARSLHTCTRSRSRAAEPEQPCGRATSSPNGGGSMDPEDGQRGALAFGGSPPARPSRPRRLTPTGNTSVVWLSMRGRSSNRAP